MQSPAESAMKSAADPERPIPDFGAIFDGHFDYVWDALGRLGIGEKDREDLVHDVFLKVHARFADYDRTRPMRPWLFGFAYRVAADHQRLARHRVEVLGVPLEVAVDDVRPEERMQALEDRDLLISALRTIELDRRAVLVMHDLEDMAIPEVARMLDIPLNTAYSRLRLAREQLAREVTRLRSVRGAR
jgi:RNA polymerase sigma-70 factor (ECF subfamily)